MQIDIMNGSRRGYGVMNTLSRTSPAMQGLSRTSSDMMNGLSRLEAMSDDEMDDTLGKLRIRFGKGKGRARRQEKRAIRREAKAIKKGQKKIKRMLKKTSIRKGRKKQVKELTKFVSNIAEAIGIKRPEEVSELDLQRILAEEPDLIEWKDRKFWGLKNPVALGVYGGGGLAVIGLSAWAINRQMKKKKGRKKRGR